MSLWSRLFGEEEKVSTLVGDELLRKILIELRIGTYLATHSLGKDSHVFRSITKLRLGADNDET